MLGHRHSLCLRMELETLIMVDKSPTTGKEPDLARSYYPWQNNREMGKNWVLEDFSFIGPNKSPLLFKSSLHWIYCYLQPKDCHDSVHISLLPFFLMGSVWLHDNILNEHSGYYSGLVMTIIQESTWCVSLHTCSCLSVG